MSVNRAKQMESCELVGEKLNHMEHVLVGSLPLESACNFLPSMDDVHV